jgi:ketosteroid isomerase-like protein
MESLYFAIQFYSMRLFLLAFSSVLFTSCETTPAKVDKNTIKKEIVAVEKEFAAFLKDSGVAAAFYKYAAPDAVIKRGNETDTLIRGKKAIREYYSGAAYQHALAEWSPDFVDVSEDGTMAYTYGKYIWIFIDTNKKESRYSGVFHTVWKKMDDGTWKYVWD